MSLNKLRELEYSLAINEALHQVMNAHDDTILIGQGLKSPWYVGNTCRGLLEAFGEDRVIDTPVSENAMTGMAVGASISGNRSIVVHPRMDFMLYAFDPIINEAANWSFMSGGTLNVPVVIWGIINRGGEQAAQHSQALHALFAHIPGLKVVMPSTAYDAKGLMVAAIMDPNPVIFIDDRLLYQSKSVVPEEMYSVTIGEAAIRTEGADITIVAVSYMAFLAEKVSQRLSLEGIRCEVVDLRTVKPLDTNTIFNSIRKTGRVVIADVGWKSFGISAEIAAVIAESGIVLKTPLSRLALPDVPAPASRSLESEFYIDEEKFYRHVKNIFMK
ncbi:MAG: transketolase C-terminal domain-containing protein [Bacteroidota bacterium]